MKAIVINKTKSIGNWIMDFAKFVMVLAVELLVAAALYDGIDDLWFSGIYLNEYVEFILQMIVFGAVIRMVGLIRLGMMVVRNNRKE